MASTREAAVLALVTALETTGALVSRDTDLPEAIPPEGYIVVAEGSADVVDTIISPLSYDIEQSVDLDIMVSAGDETERDAKMDALLTTISAALTADRTLGATVDWTEIGAPDFQAFEADGAAKAARLPVILSFVTLATPLT